MRFPCTETVSCLPCVSHTHAPHRYLGRYEVDPGPPVHRSATCEVLFATDAARGGQRVAIKIMRNRWQFEAEARAAFDAQCFCFRLLLYISVLT